MGLTGTTGVKPLNLVWIVVDSVRNYRSGGDDRDKLDVMYELGPESIEFETVVTTAPSTVMSGSTMMTGCPSYLIGRDYDNFSYDRSEFTSLGEVLRRRGYTTEGVMWFLHSRQRLGGKVIDLMDRRYWPKGLKFGRNWDNDEVSHILNRRLDDGFQDPFFLLAWYNCRGDPQTSEKVRRDVNRLRDMGMLDNAVFIMSSDHGYPDPSRGMGPEWFARQSLTHDLVITDDNILVPLLVQYPGFEPKRIGVPVCTMDLMPTVLDLMGVEPEAHESRRIQGKSLVPLMEGRAAPELEDRLFRSDARFMMQSQRRTAIRGEKYKYVINHDEGTEEFYDLTEDPTESRNRIDDTALAETAQRYRAEFRRSEREAVDFHLRYLLERTRGLGADLADCRRALVIYSRSFANGEMLLGAVPSLFENGTVDLLTSEPVDDSALQGYSRTVHTDPASAEAGDVLADSGDATYDVVIIPAVERNSDAFSSALALGQRLGRRYPVVVDPNLMSVGGARKRDLRFLLKVAYQRKGLYLREPQLALRDVKIALARVTAGRLGGSTSRAA